MKIEITGQAIDRPENMSIKANLEWDYLQINNGGWVAVSAGPFAIILTNESCDLSDGYVFMDEYDLVEWLEQSADDALKNEPEDFLEISGAVNLAFLDSPAVVSAMLAAIKADDEQRKEERQNGRV